MIRKTRTLDQKRRKGESLIAADKIKPSWWFLSRADFKAALRTQGLIVKEIKKVRYLKHQICISYRE